MTIENVGLFEAMGARMDFLNHRQTVISQNIANASTPNYVPKDLKGANFQAMVDSLNLDRSSEGAASRGPERTNSKHMVSGGADLNAANSKVRGQETAYEVSPDGNAVVIEEQMIKASQTVADYNLMTNLMRRNVGMVRMAIQGTNS